MTNTMTPSEIADWLDIEANTLGHIPMLTWDAPHIRHAAATIRELEARAERNANTAKQFNDIIGGLSAKLKIATEALIKIEDWASDDSISANKAAISCGSFATDALARIKRVG